MNIEMNIECRHGEHIGMYQERPEKFQALTPSLATFTVSWI